MPRISSDKLAERRARILDAAEACFARSGFHRTTMQDICREAGVSAGAVYVYFDSKEALIEGIVARDRVEAAEAMGMLAEAEDFLVALEAVLHACVLARPAHKAALFIEIIGEAHRNPRVAASLGQCDSQLRSLLRSLIERARADGRIPDGLPAERLALMMAILADGLFVRRSLDPGFDGAAMVPMIMKTMRGLLELPSAEKAAPTARPRPKIRLVTEAGR